MQDVNTTKETRRTIFANLRLLVRTDWLLICGTMFLGIMFALTSLDIIVGTTEARNFASALLNALCLDTRLFAGEIWRAVTVQFLHGNFSHLFGNLVGLWFAWFLLHRVVPGRSWFGIFLFGGAVGGAIHVLAKGSPPPDFSQWSGPLGMYFFQPGTALVGASGGVMAMLGAVTAISVRYWLLRKSVPNYLKVGPLGCLLFLCLQLYSDLTTAGVAGLAHQAGIGFGLLSGIFLTIAGNPSLVLSRPAALEKWEQVSMNGLLLSIWVTPSADFREDSDCIILRRTWIGVGKRRSYSDTILAGRQISSETVTLPLT